MEITVLEFNAHGNTINGRPMEGLEAESSGIWIPLMEYAIKKGISLSTLRRHIKANKVKFKVESGRYLLWDLAQELATPNHPAQHEYSKTLEYEVARLQREVSTYKEEIADLKTLIALYEEKIPQYKNNN